MVDFTKISIGQQNSDICRHDTARSSSTALVATDHTHTQEKVPFLTRFAQGTKRAVVNTGKGVVAMLGLAAVAHVSFGAHEMEKIPLTGKSFLKASDAIQAEIDKNNKNLIVKGTNGEDVYCTVTEEKNGADCVYKLSKDTDAYQGKLHVPASGNVPSGKPNKFNL